MTRPRLTDFTVKHEYKNAQHEAHIYLVLLSESGGDAIILPSLLRIGYICELPESREHALYMMRNKLAFRDTYSFELVYLNFHAQVNFRLALANICDNLPLFNFQLW